ncbi:MAG: NADH-quinone oxidoreductase subunit A [Cyanobacteriota bacterium]
MIIEGYGIIAAFIIFAIAFVSALLIISYIIQPKAPGKTKESTYECGMIPIGDARIQFDAKYYLYAIMFVLFDVEAVFLFPWAIAYNLFKINDIAANTLVLAIEAFIFIFILVVGLVYAWKKGVLKWQ